MELNSIQSFFSLCDQKTLTIAICVSIMVTVLRKILKDKLSVFISLYLPILLSIIIQLVWTGIIDGFNTAFTIETVYSGLITGTLSSIVTAIAIRTISGSSIRSPELMFIEGTLSEFIKKDALKQVSVEILQAINNPAIEDLPKALQMIILNNSNPDIDDIEAYDIACFIINSISTIKK